MAQIHPWVQIAHTVISSVYKVSSELTLVTLTNPAKVVKSQLDKDRKVVALFGAMRETYSYAEQFDALHDKSKQFETVLKGVLLHTTECLMFIREYAGHGFGGKTVSLKSEC